MSDTTITVQRITDLGEEPYTLREPIPVEIEATEDGFVAGFVEGLVYASGDTREEAVDELTLLTLAMFEALRSHQGELGAAASEQFRVLSQHIGA